MLLLREVLCCFLLIIEAFERISAYKVLNKPIIRNNVLKGFINKYG